MPPAIDRQEDSLDLRGNSRHAVEGRFGVDVSLDRRYRLLFGFRSRLYSPMVNAKTPTRRTLSSGITECRADILLGAIDRPPAAVTIGYFTEKYADETMNLGEYLFSSGVYPGFIISGGNGWKLLGARLSSNIIPWLYHELLFTSEAHIIPAFDFSISYLAFFRAGTIFKAGGGVMFNRIFSTRETNTTPPRDAIIIPRSETEADTVKLTHRGVKLMARMVFDPKPLFSAARLGADDLKLYAEAAILGVRDYAVYYENIAERIPVMAGFHLPVFGLFDAASIEVEWYGSPWINNPDNLGHPFPREKTKRRGEQDDVKWSIDVRKTLLQGVTLYARAASDHFRYENGAGWFESPEERMVAVDQWYYTLWAVFHF